MSEVTKEEFEAYKRVQVSGMYNMYTPEAIRETGLDKDTYFNVIKNYSELNKKYSGETDE
tara:strand:+ start:590 stop:769 length:180 start_codon:yes stop_codon:yes gene_type:complete